MPSTLRPVLRPRLPTLLGGPGPPQPAPGPTGRNVAGTILA